MRVTRDVRVVLTGVVLGGVLWALGLAVAFGAHGATYVVDSATGSDAAAGTADAPWRTWGRLLTALNAATVQPGDSVLMRPGRYAACDGAARHAVLNAPGGTAAAPITIAVDPSQPGDVEIHGGAQPGQCGLPAWSQARTCTSGPYLHTACDTDAECGGGSCVDKPGVWWTTSAPDNNNAYWGGINAGVVYQPSRTPGGAPRIYEIVYSTDPNRTALDVFTPGHNQVLSYPTLPPTFSGYQACKGPRSPWLCCTGAGAGTCSSSRVYVQTASGQRPDTVSDVDFEPVEVPVKTQLVHQGDSTVTTKHLRFSNDGNGRKFHWRWALTNIWVLKNVDGWTVEDFTAGYLSRTNAWIHLLWTGNADGSRFPRYIGGETYQLTGWWNTNGSNVVRNTVWRRGKMHAPQGNEQVHMLQGPIDRFTTHLFESIEFCDSPMAARAGETGSTCSPNAETNQVRKTWPPPGYEVWAPRYSHGYWSPLGGGGNSDGSFISSAHGHTVRHCIFRDTGLVSFFESGGAGNTVIENNTFDFGRLKYADGGWSPGVWPNLLVSRCLDVTNCGGFEGRIGLALPARFNDPGVNGVVLRNNTIRNAYANAIRSGYFVNSLSEPPPLHAPALAPIIEGNTIELREDYETARPGLAQPPIWLGYTGQSGGGSWGAADGSKAVFRGNVIYRTGTSALAIPAIRVEPNALASTTFSGNSWGPDLRWQAGGTTYTTLAQWQAVEPSPGSWPPSGVTTTTAPPVSTTSTSVAPTTTSTTSTSSTTLVPVPTTTSTTLAGRPPCGADESACEKGVAQTCDCNGDPCLKGEFCAAAAKACPVTQAYCRTLLAAAGTTSTSTSTTTTSTTTSSTTTSTLVCTWRRLLVCGEEAGQ